MSAAYCWRGRVLEKILGKDSTGSNGENARNMSRPTIDCE